MLISTLLALVFLPENPNSNTITQTQKQIIAQEFNFSETIFIHHLSTMALPRQGQLLFSPRRKSLPLLVIQPLVLHPGFCITRHLPRLDIELRERSYQWHL
jgi:hypothetical protein